MLNAQTNQIKVTLSNELFLHLKSKADKLGLNLASYVRHLVINDVKDIDIPSFKMSEKTEKIALNALEDYQNGKTNKIGDLEDYFSNLK